MKLGHHWSSILRAEMMACGRYVLGNAGMLFFFFLKAPVRASEGSDLAFYRVTNSVYLADS